jgi:hypothetical protein
MIITRASWSVLFVLATPSLHAQATPWRFGVEVDDDFFVNFDPYSATDRHTPPVRVPRSARVGASAPV